MEYKGWNIDTSNMIEEDRDSKGWYSDELYSNEKADILCLVYSMLEVRMGWSVGKLAIYKNKENPILWLNPKNILINGCRKHIMFSKNGKYIFINIHIGYNNSIYLPILIIDTSSCNFSIIYTHNSYPYSVVEVDEETIKLIENGSGTKMFLCNL